MLVDRCPARILAPGTAAPALSSTMPMMVAPESCSHTTGASETVNRAQRATRRIIPLTRANQSISLWGPKHGHLSRQSRILAGVGLLCLYCCDAECTGWGGAIPQSPEF